ncbi:MAG: class I SAM-dependent methyltransferase [Candidatus Limnocylindrales bacterium]
MARDRGARLAALYDLDLQEGSDDLDLYLLLAEREGDPILELAAGSGRLAVPLAAAGHAVTALDHDPAMLRRAASRWAEVERPARPGSGSGPGSLELVEADLLTADLGPRFALAILALNSLLLLETLARQAEALAALARHLRPDGLAVVDVWLPAVDELAAYDGRLGLEWVRDSTDGRRTAKWASARHEGATGVVELTTIFDAWPADGGQLERIERTDRLRLIGADELVSLAASAGLRTERLAADYELAPFGPGAERVLLLGRLV